MPKRKTAVEKMSDALSGQLLSIGQPPVSTRPGVIQTGIPGLDDFLVNANGQQIGGIPRGTHWLFAGAPKIGKSLMVTHMIAAFQRQDLVVAHIPSERDVTTGGPERLANLGVQTDKLLYVGHRTDSSSYVMEEVLGIISMLAIKEAIDVAVIDSVTHLVPRSIAEGLEATADEKNPDKLLSGKQSATFAAAIARNLPAVAGTCSDKGVSLIMVGQQRMRPQIIGDPRYVPGGNTLAHECSGIFWVNRPEKLRAAEEKVADHHHFFKLQLKESRLSTGVGDKRRVALPTDRPLWESELHDQPADPD